jgi:hypothetical protein
MCGRYTFVKIKKKGLILIEGIISLMSFLLVFWAIKFV